MVAHIRIRSTLVCLHEGKVLVFKGVDPTTGREYWFLPGGKIENGESPLACAERETLEETGYEVKALPQSELIKHYKHEWDGAWYDCKTHFFKGVLLGKFHEPRPVNDVEYNRGAMWLPLQNALDAFAYTPEIRDAVEALAK